SFDFHIPGCRLSILVSLFDLRIPLIGLATRHSFLAFSPLALYPVYFQRFAEKGHAEHHSRVYRHRLHLVRRVPLLYHLSRSFSRLGRQTRRRRNRGPRRAGLPQSRAAHPPFSVGHGHHSHRRVFRHGLHDRMGQRALRSALGAPPSPPRRLDGPRRPRRQFFVDASCRRTHPNRVVHGLRPSESVHRLRGFCLDYPLLFLFPQSSSRRFQLASRSPSRRQLRRHDLHERKSSSALPRLAPRQQLWNDRLAARFPRLSLYLRPRRKIRHLLFARLSPMISRAGNFGATAAQRRAPLRNTETSPVP